MGKVWERASDVNEKAYEKGEHKRITADFEIQILD